MAHKLNLKQYFIIWDHMPHCRPIGVDTGENHVSGASHEIRLEGRVANGKMW